MVDWHCERGARQLDFAAGQLVTPPEPLALYWRDLLRGDRPLHATSGAPIRTVDLFCGAGGFAGGIAAVCALAGRPTRTLLAADHDDRAVDVFAANHPTEQRAGDVTELVDYEIDGVGAAARFVRPPTLTGAARDLDGEVDLLVGGPPCQGHSPISQLVRDVSTRGTDPRNLLYLAMPAFAVACRARAVLIENVPNVINDARSVVAATIALLRSAGYSVDCGALAADALGWPQTRRRFFISARLDTPPVSLVATAATLARTALPVTWAICDGRRLSRDARLHEHLAVPASDRVVIDWLFDHDAYESPISVRRDLLGLDVDERTFLDGSHRRLYPDRPANTITTEAYKCSAGRFVHPFERRTLSAAECARLQGFPDDYCWRVDGEPSPLTALYRWIGNAVPLPLGFAAASAVLSPVLLGG